MKEKCLLAAFILATIIHGGGTFISNDYGAILIPNIWGNTEITWRVADCPSAPFSLYWSGNGYWLAQPDSRMTLTVLAVGQDIEGIITLGNRTWRANDTDLAKDLALGVWGLTAWLPGLIVKTGEGDLNDLNETAFESAQRLAGNYLNGTMSSHRGVVEVSGVAYNCLVFDYEQDETSYGEPQRTYLAYDTGTGLLVRGNTTYSFGTPYRLSIEFSSVYTPASVILTVTVVFSVGVVIVLLVCVIKRR